MQRREFLALAFTATALSASRPTASAAAPLPSSDPYGPLQPANADGIRLPAGFRSRRIATSGELVASTPLVWPALPDGGACMERSDGGWVYLANGESAGGAGSVAAISFDAMGNITDGYRVLRGTTRSCSGGMTPWGTYLSGEEWPGGNVFECDPLRPSQGIRRPALGTFNHEMITVDPVTGHVYMVEDHAEGRFYRFVPTTRGDLSSGTLYAARLSGGTSSGGTVAWVPVASDTPARGDTTVFAGGEGLDILDRTMYFTTKFDVRVLRLDLTTLRVEVFYDGLNTPGASLDAVDNLVVHRPSAQLFVAEDGGNMEIGVLTTTGPITVSPFLRIIGQDSSEVSGVAFDPSGSRLYLSSQRGADGITGRTYEVSGPFTNTLAQLPPAKSRGQAHTPGRGMPFTASRR